MGRCRPSHTRKKNRDVGRAARTRARKRDLDQIHEDLLPLNVAKRQSTCVPDPDLPGLGLHYCVECARHFTDADALNTHVRTKLHKKRLRLLKEAPFTIAEAERAGGLQTDKDRSLHARLRSGAPSSAMDAL